MAVDIPFRHEIAFEYGRLEPIAPGLDRKVFAARLENVLEEATARLVAEAGIRGSEISNQGSGIKDQ